LRFYDFFHKEANNMRRNKRKKSWTGKSVELKVLNELYRVISSASKQMLGYPASLVFDYSILLRFLKFHINNVGDPYANSGYYRINTLDIERRVIDRFAELFHAPKNSYWGYVTSGGTEGNLYGLYVARECYPNGVVYYSDQAHYSVIKNLRVLKIKSRCITSQPNGEIDYNELRKALKADKDKTVPILFATIGTTMKGAIDDIEQFHEILSSLKIEEFYIHCDAACFGMILPFLPDRQTMHFDFRAKIDSIAISGHKVIGTPIPCGVVLLKKSHAERVENPIEYIGHLDRTISGSRSGLTPLFLWHEMIYSSEKKFERRIHACMKKAQYAIEQFQKAGIPAWRNPNSVIVVFPRPSENLARKWQLAVEGEISHIITLPHVTRKIINQLVEEVALEYKNE
jgi:histidine decarboxylase